MGRVRQYRLTSDQKENGHETSKTVSGGCLALEISGRQRADVQRGRGGAVSVHADELLCPCEYGSDLYGRLPVRPVGLRPGHRIRRRQQPLARGRFQPENEPGQENGRDNPFMNSLTADFRLRRPTQAGIRLSLDMALSLESGYSADADGNGETRGADGVWDRGAFEFITTPRRPPAPSNVRIRLP